MKPPRITFARRNRVSMPYHHWETICRDYTEAVELLSKAMAHLDGKCAHACDTRGLAEAIRRFAYEIPQ